MLIVTVIYQMSADCMRAIGKPVNNVKMVPFQHLMWNLFAYAWEHPYLGSEASLIYLYAMLLRSSQMSLQLHAREAVGHWTNVVLDWSVHTAISETWHVGKPLLVGLICEL